MLESGEKERLEKMQRYIRLILDMCITDSRGKEYKEHREERKMEVLHINKYEENIETI